MAKRPKEILQKIAERYGLETDMMKAKEDHVHLFLTALPRYSLSQIAQDINSISAKVVFREFPEVEKQLRGSELWNNGYFVGSERNMVTSAVIRQCIK